jgi:5-methylcytosine-specific restriction endonuclease McrA
VGELDIKRVAKAEYDRAYGIINKERRAEQHRIYYMAHREEIKNRTSLYQKTHKDTVGAYHREYNALNKDVISEKAKIRYASSGAQRGKIRVAYEKSHKDIILIRKRAYRAANKDKMREYHKNWYASKKGGDISRAAWHRYHARKIGAFGANYTTAKMISDRHEVWGNKCYICGKLESKIERLATDHVKPLSSGGAHLPCNLRPICLSCNSAKGNKWPYMPIARSTMSKGWHNGT